jgi:hypothetical protein
LTNIVALGSLLKQHTYTIFKILGISFVKPIEGFFCRLCKKLILASLDDHCQTKEHYDKFVDIVNGKKSKAFELEVAKRTSEQLAASKRKVLAMLPCGDDDDEEDDSGNWKRKRKMCD